MKINMQFLVKIFLFVSQPKMKLINSYIQEELSLISVEFIMSSDKELCKNKGFPVNKLEYYLSMTIDNGLQLAITMFEKRINDVKNGTNNADTSLAMY